MMDGLAWEGRGGIGEGDEKEERIGPVWTEGRGKKEGKRGRDGEGKQRGRKGSEKDNNFHLENFVLR